MIVMTEIVQVYARLWYKGSLVARNQIEDPVISIYSAIIREEAGID